MTCDACSPACAHVVRMGAMREVKAVCARLKSSTGMAERHDAMPRPFVELLQRIGG